ncbi:MAG: glycosyltransferase family 10 [Pseudomonadota bacterium]
MPKIIAYCTNATVLNGNKILIEEIAAKYPGALWVTKLAQHATTSGILVVTGDVALKKIQDGIWKSEDICVIQEERSLIGNELVKLGAITSVLVCLESPMYARIFYEKLHSMSAGYSNRVLFSGAFDLAPPKNLNNSLFFPSFSQNFERRSMPWNQRKFMVMVAANKFWEPIGKIPKRPIRFVLFCIDALQCYTSPIWRSIRRGQLHDTRLKLIEYFGKLGKLDLFGRGWQDLAVLPSRWQKRLKPVLEDIKPVECDDKAELIVQYKYAVCFENMAYPGYVTEKILDCLSAGVIPIYLGAPDITDFINSDAFIDFRDFANLNELHEFLEKMTEAQANHMIEKGEEFLRSEKGKQFSYEVFSKSIFNLIKKDLQLP